MEILFKEKENIDGCNSKKETGFVFLHGLNQLRMLLYEQDDQFQREHSSSSEISLRVLPLKSKSQPMLSRNLWWTTKIQRVKLFY